MKELSVAIHVVDTKNSKKRIENESFSIQTAEKRFLQSSGSKSNIHKISNWNSLKVAKSDKTRILIVPF
jgi:hypothetical protein